MMQTCNDIDDPAGTPAFVARLPDDPAMLAADDTRTRRKNTPGEQSMRRSIQDLVASIDPNVKVEPEVEDVSLFSLRLSDMLANLHHSFYWRSLMSSSTR
jgi:hypothetical protein